MTTASGLLALNDDVLDRYPAAEKPAAGIHSQVNTGVSNIETERVHSQW